jgi:PA14 domain/Bacterial Ig domain
VDGSVLGSVTAAPYSLNWNTLLSADGSHVLNAIVTDSLGHTGTASIGVTVRNHAITDTTPPTIQLLSPQNNATISGLTNLSATAGDNVAVARVVFLVDGVSVGVATNSPYTVQLDSTGMTGGLHYVSAQAFDAAGNQASTNNSVSVANSQAPACSASGIRAFVGCYYSDAALGTPVLSRLDQELNFDWGTGSPGPGVPSSVFSATWRGSFNFDGGNYSFNAVANGGYRLYVDGQLIQDLWIQNSSSNLQIKSAVAAGSHSVMVQYHTGTGNEMKLSWSRL